MKPSESNASDPVAPLVATKKSIVIGVAYLVAALAMAAYYFSLPGTWGPVKGQWSEFYLQLHPEWIHVGEDEVWDSFLSGKMDAWNTLLARAALSRWRIRAVSAKPFDHLMAQWNKGTWLCPPKHFWELFCQQLDREWLAARAQALGRNPPRPFEIQSAKNAANLVITGKGAFFTHEIGSLLVIELECSRPEDLPEKGWAGLIWGTDISPHNWHQIRTASYRFLGRTPEGKFRFELEYDFSWEPAWLHPQARLSSCILRMPGPEAWKLIRLSASDSPMLAPRQATP